MRGRVVPVCEVTRELIERRSLRVRGHGAPPDAVMPATGRWPLVVGELGDGVSMGSRPSRYVVEAAPVPGTVELHPAHGVRLPSADQDEPLPLLTELTVDPPLERRMRSRAGWLIDVDESAGIAAQG